MKTYIISTSAPGKAIPNYFLELAKALVDQGNKVIIVFDGKHKEPALNNDRLFETWPSERPTRLKDFIFYYNLCKKYQPDVVLGQFSSTNITLIVGRLLSVPNRIIYWHTMFLQLKADSTKSKLISKTRHWTKKILLRYFSTLIMTNSSATKNDLTDNYKLSNIKVFNYLIPDPIKLNSIVKKKERDFAISFIGRIDKSKGQELIINEIPDVITHYPKLNFYFVGDGTEKNRLEEKCLKLNITKNVTFTGPVTLDSVYGFMGKSLIHISASIEEAFGLVNAEALSVGTPILANKVGGIVDVLREGENGFFLDTEKKGDLRIKIQKIIDGNWDSLSKNARNYFLERFEANEENVENQLNELKKEIRPKQKIRLFKESIAK